MIVGQLTKNEDDSVLSRYKRGMFYFIGGISKILFGTLHYDDAITIPIKLTLENEQVEFLKLSKEQLTVVKSMLRS